MTPAERAAAIARCDAEIARIENTHDDRAYLCAMGANDWGIERSYLQSATIPVALQRFLEKRAIEREYAK